MSIEAPPLSLYVHLPWCVRKCPYCDFNSHAAGKDAPREAYVAAILADIDIEAARAGGREVQSIYLGGGTPSLFTATEIGTILDAAAGSMHVAADCEITMEANPGTVECGSFRGYRAAGVNRVSLGAQSFDGEMLKALGRIHGPGEINAAFEDAAAAGFDSINIDLMFALPRQTLEMALADLAELCRLAPPHVSWYQLTIEPNTEFHARPPRNLPDDDLAWEMQAAGHRVLVEAGYGQYEVSAFARDGHRCRHNLNYWTFGDYLAVGAGAHGKFTGDDSVIRRYRKAAHPRSYMEQMLDGPREPALEALGGRDAGFEFLLNALRLPEGFSEQAFTSRTGQSASTIEAPLGKAREDGLVEQWGEHGWRPTPLGFRFLNDLQARFLP